MIILVTTILFLQKCSYIQLIKAYKCYYYEIEYKNRQGEMHSNPQMMVFPNQEAKITLSSDLNHTYEMLVVAARE